MGGLCEAGLSGVNSECEIECSASAELLSEADELACSPGRCVRPRPFAPLPSDFRRPRSVRRSIIGT
jgi:hypothetical protein